MATALSISVPDDLASQAMDVAAAQSRTLDGLVATAVEQYVRDYKELHKIMDQWHAESWEQGIRSEEDVQAILDGTLTFEDLKQRA